MKWLTKTFALLGLLGAISEKSAAQTIFVDFANKQVSPDGLHWTFDLVAKGASTNLIYDGPENDNWQALNLRLDLEVPAGIAIIGGSGVPDPAYADRAAVQTAVPGNPGLNRVEVGFTVSRSGQNEINTSTFTKLATFTVDFSGPVLPTNKVFPRGLSDTRGSSWTNVAGQQRRPLSVEGTQMTDHEITLPVSLIAFEAKKEGKVVHINWQTAEEENSERFEIERSQDGKQWDLIRSIAAAGQSKSLRSYHAVDEQPTLLLEGPHGLPELGHALALERAHLQHLGACRGVGPQEAQSAGDLRAGARGGGFFGIRVESDGHLRVFKLHRCYVN